MAAAGSIRSPRVRRETNLHNESAHGAALVLVRRVILRPIDHRPTQHGRPFSTVHRDEPSFPKHHAPSPARGRSRPVRLILHDAHSTAPESHASCSRRPHHSDADTARTPEIPNLPTPVSPYRARASATHHAAPAV